MNDTAQKTLETKIEAIRENSIREKMNLLKSIIDKQSDRLKADIKHLIKKTLCDKTYPNSLNKNDIEIITIDFDFETLEYVVAEIELEETTSIYLVSIFTVKGVEIRLGAWINLGYDMKLNEADFNLGTPCNDIDCNFAHGNMIVTILKEIKVSLED